MHVLPLLFFIVMRVSYICECGDDRCIPENLMQLFSSSLKHNEHNGKCKKFSLNKCEECKAVLEAMEEKKKNAWITRPHSIRIDEVSKWPTDSDSETDSFDSDIDSPTIKQISRFERAPNYDQGSTSKSQDTPACKIKNHLRNLLNTCKKCLGESTSCSSYSLIRSSLCRGSVRKSRKRRRNRAYRKEGKIGSHNIQTDKNNSIVISIASSVRTLNTYT